MAKFLCSLPSWQKKFLIIYLGQAFSILGSSAAQFALIWWLSVTTNSPWVLSLGMIFGFLPQALLGPFVGVIIDRVSRAKIMIWADLLIAFASLVFAICFNFNFTNTWLVYLLLLVRALGSVFHAPAMQAAIPLFVPAAKLPKTAGWTQFLTSGSFIGGTVIGATLYAITSLPVIMLIDVVGAIIACFTIYFARLPELPHRSLARVTARQVWKELCVGAKLLWQHRLIRDLTFVFLFVMIFSSPTATLYPLMTSSYFLGSAWQASLVEVIFAVGMMAAGALIGLKGTSRRPAVFTSIMFVIFGSTALLAGLLPATFTGFCLFVSLSFFMGAAVSGINAPYMALIQSDFPPESLGKVSSLTMSLTAFTIPIGLILTGPVAQAIGVNSLFFWSGLVVTLIGLISIAYFRTTKS